MLRIQAPVREARIEAKLRTVVLTWLGLPATVLSLPGSDPESQR